MAVKTKEHENGVSSMEEEMVIERVLTFEELDATQDLDVVYVPLPEPYNGGVRVRPLTMHQLHQIRKDASKQVKNKQTGKWETVMDELVMNREMIRMCLVEPVLEGGQVDRLLAKSSKLGRAILEPINRINGFTEDDAKETVKSAEAEFPE